VTTSTAFWAASAAARQPADAVRDAEKLRRLVEKDAVLVLLPDVADIL
jgi:hypothetical protein